VKITYRHGYYPDVEYDLISAELWTDQDFPYFRVEVIDGPSWPLFVTSIFYENGKTVFQCPENF
jgi:hypothetical protein